MPPFTQNFGWYARLMVALAAIAYTDPMECITTQVDSLPQADSAGWSVVWGPSELSDDLGISYSRAYIARADSPSAYAVVIRGTNFISWQSWTLQDFDIGTTMPFRALLCPSDTVPCAYDAPSSARISQGTYNGMNDLLSIRDPRTGQTMVEFLRGAPPGSLYVTGHSLGGTLTPPMFAYLHEVLGWEGQQMAPFSFAGLTAGDSGFNAYFNTMVDTTTPWRFHNTLDIAPFLWDSLSGLQFIYGQHSLGWGTLEADWLRHKFREAESIGYAHPAGGDLPLTGQFARGGFLDDDAYDWTDQALYQHHGGTYRMLVDSTFGAPTTASLPACRARH
jgi:hypothetical protein